jgi:hypothetical protein
MVSHPVHKDHIFVELSEYQLVPRCQVKKKRLERRRQRRSSNYQREMMMKSSVFEIERLK